VLRLMDECAGPPAPPVRAALAQPAGSQEGASTSDGRRAPATERLDSPKLKARPGSARDPASRDGDGDGIRVIDLGSSWQ
jgi:hypothetical protein